MRHAVLAGLVLVICGTMFANEPGRHTLAFEERVTAQRAIEDVYWRHRIWPKENPAPKPPLSAFKSDAAIRASVADYLKKSSALERIWSRQITTEQLQAEMDRMVHGTKDSQTLQEFFHALGDDPFVVAETLVRQTVVDRLIRSWYAYDDRFHGDVRHRAESARARSRSIEGMRSIGGEYHEATYRLRSRDSQLAAHNVLELDPDEWDRRTHELAVQFGAHPGAIPLRQLSDVQEAPDTFFVTVLLSQDDKEVRIAQIVWPKRSFDSWWQEQSTVTVATLPSLDAEYTLAAASSGACTDDTWERSYYSPGPRTSHSAVWTGTEMIVWGGYRGGNSMNTGARYNPVTDSWTEVSSGGNAPTPRSQHSAVWTGTEMIVWGGENSGYGYVNTGGRYNPTSDTWIPTSTAPLAPSMRTAHSAVWTGTEMIVWGGFGDTRLNTGGRYNPSSDSWTATSTTGGVPEGRGAATAVWTGTEMIVWGGRANTNLNTGGRYNPSSDTWIATSTGANAPSAREGHSAVWTGNKMIIWGGGTSGGVYLNTGSLYHPVTDSWTATSIDPSASGRGGHAAVWTGTEMIVWGGYGNGLLNTGARFDPTSDSWAAISNVGASFARVAPTGVWTGSEMIVWGGNASAEVGTGGRYNPVTDSWVPTPPGPTMPTPRAGQASVWTGTELIVWGGSDAQSPYYPQNGGRYVPALDAWTMIGAGANLPAARTSASAVWTGVEMIMWGGQPPNGGDMNSGGRYNPTSDTWVATSVGVNVPSSRSSHRAVWTGTKMIVWGGFSNLNTGGQYDPATDAWTPTTLGAGTPSGRYGHSAIWTGQRLVIWGGWTQSGTLNTGARYDPFADAWSPVSIGANVPSARAGHVAVWTGKEMIVWGGTNGSAYTNTGGRYDPDSDTWVATSTSAGAPAPRQAATGLWTGKELLVWGGSNNFGQTKVNSGGRYDPSAEVWRPTSVGANTPPGGSGHSVAWTGTQIVLWGGSLTDTSMYRYCGFTCTGLPTASPLLVVAKASSGSRITLAWNVVAGATAYEIVRGSLANLRASGGDFSLATEACVADELAATSVVDDGVDSEWYLVRVVACGETASYDSGQSSQSQPRDAEIQASGHACP